MHKIGYSFEQHTKLGYAHTYIVGYKGALLIGFDDVIHIPRDPNNGITQEDLFLILQEDSSDPILQE